MPQKLFLIDAMAVIYRAHFALSKNPRINSKGVNTSVIYGFTNSLLEIIQKQKPTHIAVAFDTAAPTFRHTTYPDYKANRHQQPELITVSLQPIKDLLAALQIPILAKDGFEADDIIGTIAKTHASKDLAVYMMTNDKDYAQLVSPHIFMYRMPFRGNAVEILDEVKILEKWQIKRIEQVIDILGLQGDAVDNVPGVPGVGAKTAVKLIAQFDSIENLLDHTDQLKGKQRSNLETFRNQALLSKQLVTIDTDVPLTYRLEDLEHAAYDKERLLELFREWEFRTIIKRFFKKDLVVVKSNQLFKSESPVQKPLPQVEQPKPHHYSIDNTLKSYHALTTTAEVQSLVEFLSLQKAFALDTETTALNPFEAEIIGISFCYRADEAFYIPLEDRSFLNLLKPVLTDSNILKIGQNLKYDQIILKHYDIELAGTVFDTMLAHYIVAPDRPHNLNALARAYLNYEPIQIETLIGEKKKGQANMKTVPLNHIRDYACEDADLTFQLWSVLESKLDNESYRNLFEKIECPLVAVLSEIEYNGVCLDSDFLEEYSSTLRTDLKLIQERIYEQAGKQFNLASPKQLGQVLFDDLALEEKPQKTATGQYATGEKVLVRLASKHQIIRDILEFRTLQKLESNYTIALTKLISPRDNLLHTSYNQAITVTGRLSSSDPNLQNIPIRTEYGQKIRRAFISRSSDYKLLSADYSQIELRLMAHFSEDEALLEAFNEGQDIHKATAAKIYKVALEDVDSDMRRKAKTANFGIIYGISAFGLAERLNIPRREAQTIITAYFEEFPAVKNYMQKSIDLALEKGYAETLGGRRRYLPDLKSKNHLAKSNAERNAINTPIQGSAADLIKIAMIDIHNYLKEQRLKSKLIMQVHDELVFDIYKPELEELRKVIPQYMSNALTLKVPLLVDLGVGENWLEAH